MNDNKNDKFHVLRCQTTTTTTTTTTTNNDNNNNNTNNIHIGKK